MTIPRITIGRLMVAVALFATILGLLRAIPDLTFLLLGLTLSVGLGWAGYWMGRWRPRTMLKLVGTYYTAELVLAGLGAGPEIGLCYLVAGVVGIFLGEPFAIGGRIAWIPNPDPDSHHRVVHEIWATLLFIPTLLVTTLYLVALAWILFSAVIDL